MRFNSEKWEYLAVFFSVKWISVLIPAQLAVPFPVKVKLKCGMLAQTNLNSIRPPSPVALMQYEVCQFQFQFPSIRQTCFDLKP
jgi:hypothetical protein